MNFHELPQKWKLVTISLATLTALFTISSIGFGLFWQEYQKKCADLRAPLKKADSELLGERIEILRNNEAPVLANLYVPKEANGMKLPVIINIHGGGFVGGDADALDTQSERIANQWNAIVISVEYTTADVEPISYGAQEIKDTVLYVAKNAEKYHANSNRIYIMGYSAGAYYAVESTELLQKSGFKVAGLILCYPWTTGLSTKDLNSNWCPTLFILAGQDPISQKAKSYAESMKKVGVEVEIKEYENAVHSFIESNNPEGTMDSSQNMKEVVNPEQEKLAREAESFIKEWISSH